MELGSEFSIDLSEKQTVERNIFACLSGYHTFYTDYGRTANRLLYQYLQKKKGMEQLNVLLPSYSCDAVCGSFPRDRIAFYDLREKFTIDTESVRRLIESGKFDDGIFYLTHYFGWLQEADVLDQVRKLCEIHRITVVEDTTHSLFGNRRTVGEYCVASLRKWFPAPEGSVIYSTEKLPQDWNRLQRAKPSKKIEAMVLKQMFLGADREYQVLAGTDELNQAYRQIFAAEEEKAGCLQENFRISDLSYFLLQCEDIDAVCAARRYNYHLLQERLAERGIVLYGAENFKDNRNEVPFTAILQIPEAGSRTRDGLREYLMEHKIYCAVHWPIHDTVQKSYKHVREWTENCLSLPIDQRYGEEEMAYLADHVITYFERWKTE